MALLQSDKAIFYHPLDDATESLKSEAWAGTGTFSAAKISSGLTASTGTTPSFGSEAEFQSVNTDQVDVVGLSSTKFVVAYTVVSSGNGKAKVATVSGTSITYGAEASWFGGANDYMTMAALDGAKVVIAWRDGTGGNISKAIVGTVSGTDITFGAAVAYGGNFINNDVAALSATKFVVVYRDFGSSNEGRSKVGTVSGTDITFGAAAEFESGSSSNISIAAVSTTKFVVGWRPGDPPEEGASKVGTVSGTDITYGARADFLATSTFNASLVALDSTTVIAVYRDGADANRGKAKVGTISGTDITYGAAATFTTNSIQMGAGKGAAMLSSTAFAVVWQDTADSSHGTAIVGTVSGTTITFGTEAEFLSADGVTAGNMCVAGLGSSTFAVGYKDNADSGYGTAKVGSLAGTAARTGTSATYDTTVAATKVAFAGWLKNPSA